MKRAVTLIKGILALALLAALAGAVPWALWHYVGWPLPHRLPTWSQFTTAMGQRGIPDTTLLKALACVVWIAWAILVTSLAVELPAALRGTTARHVAVTGPIQPLVAHLLAAVIVAAIALAPRPAATPGPLAVVGGLGRPRAPITAMVLVTDAQPTTSASSNAGNGAGAPVPVSSDPLRVYVVQRNDTLWGIAERELGDPLRWSQIYSLNEGREEPDGRILDDPHWIYPGWTLLLPEPAATSPSQEGSIAEAPPAMRAPAAPPSTAPPVANPPAAPPLSHGAGTPSTHHGQPRAVASPLPVELPSGSVVAGSFAAGVFSAVAIGRLRRRHGYRPRRPEPGRCLGPPPLGPTLHHLMSARVHDDEDREDGIETADSPVLAGDDEEHRTRPDLIEIGMSDDGQPVHLAVCDLEGVGLSGPGSEDAVRAIVAALLTRAGPAGAEMLFTRTTLERLVPGALSAAATSLGVRVLDDVGALARTLEAEALARSRHLEEADLPDVVAYRRANAFEPLPVLVAVADQLLPDEWARLAPTLARGPSLGLGGVFLGSGGSTRIEIGDAHRVVAADPENFTERLHGTRLFALAADEAAEVLAALADAETRPAGDDAVEEAVFSSAPSPHEEPWPITAASAAVAAKPITLRLLGPYEVYVGDEEVKAGLRNDAKELLAWYVLRPEGAAIEAAVEALWPDTDPREVHKQFWRVASSLQRRLRPDPEKSAKLFVKHGTVYRLLDDLIDCDLWTFQVALAEAARAEEGTEARDALRRAVSVYRGDFAVGTDYRWAEPVRQDLHRRALDAQLRLAELEERLGAPHAAEEILRQAIELDRYAEEPYRRLMAIQARHRATDAVTATWKLLRQRLRDIDLECEPATVRLYRSLTSEQPEVNVEPEAARLRSV